MNTSELQSALKIHGSWPTSDDLFSESDFLSLFNHQLLIEILPMMLQLNEEFFLMTQDFTITQGSKYRVPRRATGAMFRSLHYVDGSGNHSQITRLYEEDRHLNASGYFLQRNQVELTNDYTSGTLRMKFFARPSKLVPVDECAQITAIDTGTNTVTFASVPAAMVAGELCDFVQNNNPYDLLDYDEEIVSATSTTLVFASLPDELAVGDWVTLSCESCVPMVPEELHPVLIQSALVKTLSSKKDKQYDKELETLMRAKEDAINMLDPRVRDNSNKVRTGKLLGYFSRGR